MESIVVPWDRVTKFEYGNLIPMNNKHLEKGACRAEYISLYITYQDKSELIYAPERLEEPLGMFINNPTSNYVSDRPNILGRILNHSDIVDIQMLAENENPIKTIYVPWHHEDEYNNRLMNTEVTEDLIKIDIRNNII